MNKNPSKLSNRMDEANDNPQPKPYNPDLNHDGVVDDAEMKHQEEVDDADLKSLKEKLHRLEQV